jgi:hypothetical protein
VVEVVTTHGLAERRTRFWKLVQIGHVPLFMKSVVLQQFECLYLADHSHSCLPLQVLQMGNCLSGYRRSLVFFFFLVVQGVFVLL